VCDIANLPFRPDAFDGVVSLHTIHHLPLTEHNAYLGAAGAQARLAWPSSTVGIIPAHAWLSP
jgi:hypothetical protein